MAEQNDTKHRERVLAEAVAAGKFSEERAEFWRRRWCLYPGQTEATIASLQPGLSGLPSSDPDEDAVAVWLRQRGAMSLGGIE